MGYRRIDTLQCPYCNADVVYESRTAQRPMPDGDEIKEFVCDDPDEARDDFRRTNPSGCGKTFLATFDPDDEMYVTQKPYKDAYGLSDTMLNALKAACSKEEGVAVNGGTGPYVPDDAVHPNTAKALHRRDLARHRKDTRRLMPTDEGKKVLSRIE